MQIILIMEFGQNQLVDNGRNPTHIGFEEWKSGLVSKFSVCR